MVQINTICRPRDKSETGKCIFVEPEKPKQLIYTRARISQLGCRVVSLIKGTGYISYKRFLELGIISLLARLTYDDKRLEAMEEDSAA